MSKRIKEMRMSLYQKLVQKGTPGNWEHITQQIGMFSYTGLTGKCSMKPFCHIYSISHHYLTNDSY